MGAVVPPYIASLHAALPLISSICPGCTDDKPPAFLKMAVGALLEHNGLERSQLLQGDLAGSQRAWETLAPLQSETAC